MSGTKQAMCAGVTVLLLGISACGGSESAPARTDAGASGDTGATATAATPEAEAQQIFATRCAVCHGTEGMGDGPGSSALDPKPRDYTDQEWQSSVTDEEIQQAILYGGAAIGKSPSMIANPDLTSKPEVVAALVEIIRGFGN